MNCARVRRVLLAAERPEPPPAAVRPHLSDCADCREWLRRVGTMERQLTALSVPSSSAGKEHLLRRLRSLQPDLAPVPGQSVPLPARLKERGLRKMSLAFALAATVAAFGIGLWLWPHREPRQTRVAASDPVAGWMAGWEGQRVQWLAQARTPKQHVQKLSGFTVTLKDEAVELARNADGDRLRALAQYYDQVCRQLVAMAQKVAAEERAAVLQEARNVLLRADSEMQRLAVELKSAAEPLRQIASAAREGDRQLRAILRGEEVG